MDLGNEENAAVGRGGDEEAKPAAPPADGGSNELMINNNQNHRHGKTPPRTVIVFAAVAAACILLLSGYYSPFSSSSYQKLSSTTATDSSSSTEVVELVKILEKADMGNKTILITTINDAWAEPNSMFDLLIESFQIGNGTQRFLKNLVVVALDKKAYARCLEKSSLHCYPLTTKGTDFSGEAYFMAPDYLKMMWRRIKFLHRVLDLGYSFIFTDADIMWFRDPFPHFYEDADFQIACDYFWGDSLDMKNSPNGGFNYVKANNKTVQFYKFWYTSRNTYPGLHDQDVLNKIKYDPYITKIGLRIRFLDTAFFGGFCQPSKDLNKVCTMHANCCVGLDNKIHDLQIMLDDWRKYMASSLANKTTSSWSVPQLCGAASFRPRSPKKNDANGSEIKS